MRRAPLAMLLPLFLASALGAVEPFEIARGGVKLVLYPDSGSFTVYKLSEVGKNRYESLYDDRDASATSWFSVQANGRVFKLAKKVGKPVQFVQTQEGGKFVFTLTDDFQVEQEFSLVSLPSYSTDPFVAIDTRVENTSGKSGSFALKALFDTTLGEGAGIHFYTDMRNRISSETRLTDGVDRDAWIVSGDSSNALMIIRSGSGVTVPDAVYLANWDRLNTLSWIPDFIEGRSFNTIYSINDSAVLLVWPARDLRPNEKLSVRALLGSSAGSRGKDRGGNAVLTPGSGTSGVPGSGMGSNRDRQVHRDAAIEELLSRIAAIEQSPDSVSTEELERLNAELDTLLGQDKE